MPNRLQNLVKQVRMRVGLDRPEDVLNAVGLYNPTAAGASITHESSVRISTVYACVYKISSTIASLGLNLYETDGAPRRHYRPPSVRRNQVPAERLRNAIFLLGDCHR